MKITSKYFIVLFHNVTQRISLSLWNPGYVWLKYSIDLTIADYSFLTYNLCKLSSRQLNELVKRKFLALIYLSTLVKCRNKTEAGE